MNILTHYQPLISHMKDHVERVVQCSTRNLLITFNLCFLFEEAEGDISQRIRLVQAVLGLEAMFAKFFLSFELYLAGLLLN